MKPSPSTASQPSRILIVDDDRLNLSILASILRPEGYELIEATTGEAALEKYAARRPDLVLMDVMLPGIDGFEACQRLKQQDSHLCAPVIFITAKSESDDVVQGFAAGGVDYLPKPFRAKEVAARVRLHLQNRALLEEQRHLVGQLSSANAAKNQLLGMAAHDLRNPLASVRALAGFLQEDSTGPLNADQKDLVGTILEASQSMLALVNELLDTSVLESGAVAIQLQDAALADLLQKEIRLHNINAAGKGTRIELAPGSALPARLRFDPAKLRQVVSNLLSNACKFSPPHSVITVRTELTPGGCTIAVEDQGPGIPATEQHKLFQDFGRTSVRPTAGEKSTGLGLAICRRIMEAHGGSISAESRPGHGSVFKFSLPLP
jgi:signal transduction histidine kinase